MNSISILSLLLTIFIYSSCEANPLSRIVNGDEAANFQFPWHVSLQITVSNTPAKTYCGGTLIAANYVLTAASCLRNATTIQVDIGSIEFLNPFETQNTVQFLKHPEYNDESKLNNIGIIRLQTNVTFSTNIRAILLPRLSEVGEQYKDVESYVCGFGVSTVGSNYLSNELLFARKTVITNDQCIQNFDSKFIHDSVMCAVGVNNTAQSVCYGDQGGSLVSHIDGSWIHIGISSMVHPTGCGGITPAAFTRVTPYLQWIASMTGIVFRP